jgi:hypothetical protein
VERTNLVLSKRGRFTVNEPPVRRVSDQIQGRKMAYYESDTRSSCFPKGSGVWVVGTGPGG